MTDLIEKGKNQNQQEIKEEIQKEIQEIQNLIENNFEEKDFEFEEDDFEKWKESFYKNQEEKIRLIESGNRQAIEEVRRTEREIMEKVKERDPETFAWFERKKKKEALLLRFAYYFAVQFIAIIFIIFVVNLLNFNWVTSSVSFISMIIGLFYFVKFKRIM